MIHAAEFTTGPLGGPSLRGYDELVCARSTSFNPEPAARASRRHAVAAGSGLNEPNLTAGRMVEPESAQWHVNCWPGMEPDR